MGMGESNIRINNVQQPDVDNRTMYNQADAKTMGDVNASVQALRGAAPEQVTQILRDQIQQEMRDHYLSPGQLRCYTQALTEECTRQGLLNNVTLTYESGHVTIDDQNAKAKTTVYTPADYGPQAAAQRNKNAAKQTAEVSNSVNPNKDNVVIPPQGEATRAAVLANPGQTSTDASVPVGPPGEVPRTTVQVNPGQQPSDNTQPHRRRHQNVDGQVSPSVDGVPPVVAPRPNQPAVEAVPPAPRPRVEDPEKQAKEQLKRDSDQYLQDANAGANGTVLQREMNQIAADERNYYAIRRNRPENRNAQSQSAINNEEKQWVKWEGDQERQVILPRTERPDDQNNQRRLLGDWNHYLQDANQHAPAQVLNQDMQQVIRDSQNFHNQWKSRPENQDPSIQAYIKADEQQWIDNINQQENAVIKPLLQQQQQARQYMPQPQYPQYPQYPAPQNTQPYYGPANVPTYYPPMRPVLPVGPVNIVLPQFLKIRL